MMILLMLMLSNSIQVCSECRENDHHCLSHCESPSQCDAECEDSDTQCRMRVISCIPEVRDVLNWIMTAYDREREI